MREAAGAVGGVDMDDKLAAPTFRIAVSCIYSRVAHGIAQARRTQGTFQEDLISSITCSTFVRHLFM